MISQGILFSNFSCLCSLRYAFQPHGKLCVPSGYIISRFFDRILCSLGSGSGSPGGTTRSILVPSAPHPGLKAHDIYI